MLKFLPFLVRLLGVRPALKRDREFRPFAWPSVDEQFNYDISIIGMSDRLSALRLFSRVARTGSFSSAGREMRLSQPSVSRIISMLEQEIGAALLTRTTRAVTL